MESNPLIFLKSTFKWNCAKELYDAEIYTIHLWNKLRMKFKYKVEYLPHAGVTADDVIEAARLLGIDLAEA
jgi:hypothetical protein